MDNKIGITDLQDEWRKLAITFVDEPIYKEYGEDYIRYTRKNKTFEIKIRELKQRKKWVIY